MEINIGGVSSLEAAIGMAAFNILAAVIFMIDPFLSKSKETEVKGFSVSLVKICRYLFVGYAINFAVGVLCLTVRMMIIRQTYFPEGVDVIVDLPSFVLILIFSAILLYISDQIGKSYVKLVSGVKTASDDKEKVLTDTKQDLLEPVSS